MAYLLKTHSYQIIIMLKANDEIMIDYNSWFRGIFPQKNFETGKWWIFKALKVGPVKGPLPLLPPTFQNLILSPCRYFIQNRIKIY